MNSCEPALITAVLGRLVGNARECTRNKQFRRITELIDLLKERYAPGKPFEWYVVEMYRMRMQKNETVNDLYDRLHSYLSGARASLQAKHNNAIAISTMIPITAAALRAFIRRLPDDLASAVDSRDPKTLEQAFKHAKHVEERKGPPVTHGHTTYRTMYQPKAYDARESEQRFYNDPRAGRHPAQDLRLHEPQTSRVLAQGRGDRLYLADRARSPSPAYRQVGSSISGILRSPSPGSTYYPYPPQNQQSRPYVEQAEYQPAHVQAYSQPTSPNYRIQKHPEMGYQQGGYYPSVQVRNSGQNQSVDSTIEAGRSDSFH